MSTYLEHLINKQVEASLVASVSRTVDTVADDMLRELLRDTQFRADMLLLIRRAFDKALSDLAHDAPNGDRST